MLEHIPVINTPIDVKDAKMTNAVVLAFIGDSVESLYVRCVLALSSSAKSHVLHVNASKVVNANAQADRLSRLLPLLTEEEVDIYRRARNSKVATKAKHADILTYMEATGLEAVYGYLYLTGQSKRLEILLKEAYNDIKK